jgi:hypothetical protein
MGPLKRFAFLIFFFLAINCVQAGEFVDGVEQGITPTQHAGTDITADLEEETHASEHADGGADEITVAPAIVKPCNEGRIGCSTTTLTTATSMSCAHMIAELNGGAVIAQHKMVYLKTTDQELYETDADTAAGPLGPAVGITTAACTDGAECIICVIGCIRNDAGFDWGAGAAEIGDPIYLSGTVGAGLQALMTTSGDMHQRVGFGVTADIAYFNFTYPYHIVD